MFHRPRVLVAVLLSLTGAAVLLAQGLVANAGPDRTDAVVGTPVTLDGTASSGATTYAWAFTSKPSGSLATLAAPSTATPSFTPDRRGTYVIRLTVGNGTITAIDTVSITTINRPPIASAGPDATVAVGKSVVLDGTPSSDPDHDKLTYLWTIASAPPASLRKIAGPTSVKTTLIVDRPGTYVASLVVKDGLLSSVADTKVITTLNTVPIANAGPDRVVVPGVQVELDGTASSDVDEQPLAYQWTLTRPSGSAAVLSNPTSPRPTFLADVAGSYTGTLKVSDGTLIRTDTVKVTTNSNLTPIARSGWDHAKLVAGQSITLDGGDSVDANGNQLTYTWTVTKRPSGSTAVLGNPNTPRPTFTADVTGVYTFSLAVSDGLASNLNPVLYNLALPVADAGRDAAVVVGETAVLDGSSSSHLTLGLGYGWALTYRPAGSAAAIGNPADPQPEFVPDLAGIYVAQLITFDGARLSPADTVVVAAGANTAPHVDLGSDRVAAVPSVVTLDGSAATDPDGGALTLRWALLARPAGSSAAVSSVSGNSTQVSVDVAGTYVVQLLARDGGGLAAVDTVVITTANGRPTVSIGPDRDVPLGPVALTATPTDPDGGAVSFAWRFLQRPAGSTATLGTPTSPSTTFNANVAGVYVVQMLVTDAGGLEGLDAVVVRAGAGPQIPVVTVAATDANASESGSNPGTFTFTRTGDASQALNGVAYARSGTATPGSDYAPTLPALGTVNFAAGSSTATLTITPVDDAVDEDSETVVLTLNDGPEYDLGAPNTQSATVAIEDDDNDGSSLGNGVTRLGAITTAGEVDTWSFTAAAGDRIAVHIGEITDANGFVPWIRLQAPDDTILGNTWNTDAAAIDDVVAPTTGVYRVLVASADSGLDGTGTYRLAMTHTPGPVGEALTNGGIHTGEIVQGDLDVWTLNAIAGERIAVHIGEMTDTDGFTPWIRLWSPTGASLGDTWNTEAAALDDVVAPVTGAYLVLVASADSGLDGTGTYRLTMTHTPGPITVSAGDQGGPLTNGAIHTGEILQGDLDIWTFTANAGQRIGIHIGEMTDPDGFTPWIRLWSPSGASLGDTWNVEAAAIDDVVAPVTGSYVVLVASADSGLDSTGTYRLTMTHTPGPITVSAGDQGGPLTNGAIHTGEILQGDVDVWTFTANVGERIGIHIGEMTDPDGFTPWIRLWSPAGASLGDAWNVEAAAFDDVVAPVTGTYLLLVASADSGLDGTGTYRLTMTHTPGPITVSAGDQGGPLTNGAIHTGEILQGDVDIWTFTANAGERIGIHIGEMTDPDGFTPWIRLWSPSGASLGDTWNVEAAALDDVVAPVTGTYLVLVASADSGLDGTGTYRLTMTHTPGPITVSAGDQGGPLTNGAIHTGEILQGDVDIWTFTANAGQRIGIHIGEMTDPDGFTPWIRLWSPTGATLGDTWNTDAAALDDVVAPVTGTYLVLVASADSGLDATGTYRLTMTHTPGPIAVTPGDQGGALTGGATHAGEIVQGDVDVWTIAVTAGSTISVNVAQTSETDDFRPWIRLWSPAGGTLGDTWNTDGATIPGAVAPATGTYLVLVASADSGLDGTGTYSLTVTVTP